MTTDRELLIQIINCAIAGGGWTVYRHAHKEAFSWTVTENKELYVRYELYQATYSFEQLILNKEFIAALQRFNHLIIFPSIQGLWHHHYETGKGIESLHQIINQIPF